MHLKSENRLFSCVEQVLEELAALCRGKPAPREDGQGYLMIQRAFILPVDREDLCALYSQLRQCAALARALGGRLPPLAQPLLDWRGAAVQALECARQNGRGGDILAHLPKMERDLEALYALAEGPREALLAAATAQATETLARMGVKKS